VESDGLSTFSHSVKQPLDYGEEVHWSRNLGEWSNVIGYEMGSSPAKVYTTIKSSPMDNFKDE
jgi:hypothetical protein